MAPLDHMTLGRALLLLVCFIGLFHSTNATYKCYNCETKVVNDSCATTPSTAKTVECGGLKLSKCRIKHVTNLKTHAMESIDRDCGVNIPLFGGKSKCTEKGGLKTCVVYCSSKLCNDVVETAVDGCAESDCKGVPKVRLGFHVCLSDYKDALKNSDIWASIAATLQQHGAKKENTENEDNKPEDSPHGTGDSEEDEFSDFGFPDGEDSISVLPKSASSTPSLAIHSTSLPTRTSSPSTPFRTSSTPRTSTQRNRKKRNSDDSGIEKAIIDLCTGTKQRRENLTQTKDEDETFLQSYYYRLKNLPKNINGAVQLQRAQIFFNAENAHLPRQPIMPLPRQYAQSSHTHMNPLPPVYREYSSEMAESDTSDIVAMAMQELN